MGVLRPVTIRILVFFTSPRTCSWTSPQGKTSFGEAGEQMTPPSPFYLCHLLPAFGDDMKADRNPVLLSAATKKSRQLQKDLKGMKKAKQRRIFLQGEKAVHKV